jgi:hypothetical protein
MLMRFHFGLGVGHVYSHHRTTQAELQREGSHVQAVFTHDVQDPPDSGEIDEDGSEDEDEDEDEDDAMVGAIGQQFSASDDSLLEEFEEMYDSELVLDYEN